MKLDMIRPTYETEGLMRSLNKNCETLIRKPIQNPKKH